MNTVHKVIACVLMGFLMQITTTMNIVYAAEGEALSEGKHKISFDPFYVSLLKRGRVVGQAELRVILQLENGDDYEEFNNLKTQVRADFMSALTELARVRFDVNQPIDPDIVKAYLTPFVDYRLGEGKVQIYIQHALIEAK